MSLTSLWGEEFKIDNDNKAILNKISSSNDWVESSVKPSFIATLDSYITTFTALEDAIDAYIQYINIKADDFDALDSAFG